LQLTQGRQAEQLSGGRKISQKAKTRNEKQISTNISDLATRNSQIAANKATKFHQPSTISSQPVIHLFAPPPPPPPPPPK